MRRGTHFAQPTEDAIWVAAELGSRFGLPLWRFGNSGTEATMDAVHLMRAITGRDLIIKVEGCYHGHHDSVQVSVLPDADEIGPREHPTGVAATPVSRLRSATSSWSSRSTISSRRARARRLRRPRRRHDPRADHDERRHHPAGAGLSRRACATLLHRHDALLTFDEVKTGFTTGPGGATARYGVVPDIVCLAKALGGGISVAAIGGTAQVMGAIADGPTNRWHVQRQPAGDGRGAGDAFARC